MQNVRTAKHSVNGSAAPRASRSQTAPASTPALEKVLKAVPARLQDAHAAGRVPVRVLRPEHGGGCSASAYGSSLAGWVPQS